jgi:hypothetical protein
MLKSSTKIDRIVQNKRKEVRHFYQIIRKGGYKNSIQLM